MRWQLTLVPPPPQQKLQVTGFETRYVPQPQPVCTSDSWLIYRQFFQVAGKGNSVMCYGPVVPDGYASCYNPLGNTINFGLSAFKSGHGTDVKTFHDALIASFDDMEKVMAVGHQSKAKL
jgi:hypothetical protein